tara:strand:+ start:443 stop:1021 length:579 start_codon:yes stop_codon:yes gene_type:complete
MNLLTNTNKKIKKTGKMHGVKLFEFNLPAIDSCPFAKDCIAYCFANKGTYLYKNVQDKYNFNFKLIENKAEFKKLIQNELESKKVEYVRIHSSGDFYSLKYLKTWVEIAKNNPNIVFYGYTKSVPFFKHINAPDNFVFCFSTGGKKDNMIKDTDKKAVIFKNLDELKVNGYTNCTEDDMAMITTDKIGLVYH